MSVKPKTTTTTDESEETVAAQCDSCGDEHPLSDRSMGTTTTVCPVCEGTSYTSVSYGTQTIKPDNERIADTVRNVSGIGKQTRENIVQTFPTYYDFEAADEKQLREIDGVGRQTASRIATKK